MTTKRIVRWVIVLFLLAALPVMTAVMAQEQAPSIELLVEQGSDGGFVPAGAEGVQLDAIDLEPQAVDAATTTRVSVSSAGTQGNEHSLTPAISADGRYVAFDSEASNLVTGDTNGLEDIFVHDRQTGSTTRVSINSAGDQSNGGSWRKDISSDGRYIAFDSYGSNLVPGDTNNVADVFVHDRQTGQTSRISVTSAGNQSDQDSSGPTISADGRYVAFGSYASNLVPGDTNGVGDVFVRDRQTGQTIRVSVSSAGSQGDGGSFVSAISADGRYVAFHSEATNLVSGDTNGDFDVFVRDLQTGQTSRVSVDSAGNQGNAHSWLPNISADGRYVVFEGGASNLVSGDTNGMTDAFIHDRQTGQTDRISVSSTGIQGNSGSLRAAVSADGRFVAFVSNATNLVNGDTNEVDDMFVRDRQTGKTSRVSVSSAGKQGNRFVESDSEISADGRYIAFSTIASNLVAGDTNGHPDVFVRDQGLSGPTYNVSESESNNTRGTADAISIGDVIGGKIGSTGDIDYFRLDIPATIGWAGYILVDIEASSIGSGLDPIVCTTRYDGYDEVCNDNTDTLDSMVFSVVTENFSPYYISVRESGNDAGGNNYNYQLIVSSPLLISANAANLGTGNVAGIPFQSQDILAWSALNTGGEKWVMFFDGSDVGVTKPMASFTFGGYEFWMVFPAGATLPGVGATTAYRPVRYVVNTVGPATSGTFTHIHTGWNSATGLSTSGEKIDAYEIYAGEEGCMGEALSTVGIATITSWWGNAIKAADEDLFCWRESEPFGWDYFFDGSMVTGLATEDVYAMAWDNMHERLMLTILGTGKIAGHAVNQKQIFAINYPSYTWGGVVWNGPDHGWNYNIDAFEWTGW